MTKMSKYLVTVETSVQAGDYQPGQWEIELIASSEDAAKRRVFWSMIAKYGLEPEDLKVTNVIPL
jgi:hypothetical protein